MALYNQIFLVFAISLFLTTLPSKAYNTYRTNAPSVSPYKRPSASASASTSTLTSTTSLPSASASVATKPTYEIPKKAPVVSNGDVNTYLKAIMDATMAKTDDFIINVIEKRLADPKTTGYSRDCLETCKSVYQDAVYAMKKTEEDVKVRNYYKANVDVSAMSTNIDTCNECVTSIYGDDTEFKKFDVWAQGIASDCLDKITSQPNY